MKKLATTHYLADVVYRDIGLLGLKTLYFMYSDLLSNQQNYHRYKRTIYYDL